MRGEYPQLPDPLVRRMTEAGRKARVEGNEFVILQMTNPRSLRTGAAPRAIPLEGPLRFVLASASHSVPRIEIRRPDRNADTAMYRARQIGKTKSEECTGRAEYFVE